MRILLRRRKEVLKEFLKTSQKNLKAAVDPQEKQIYEFGPFSLDPAERLLMREGAPMPLTPKAFETLLVLVQNSGHLVEKGELLKAVWSDTFVEEGNLTQNIFTLRRILGEGKGEHQYIETVPKRGYRFVATVRVVDDGGPDSVVDGPAGSNIPPGEKGPTRHSATSFLKAGASAERTTGPEYEGGAANAGQHTLQGRGATQSYKQIGLLAAAALIVGLVGLLTVSRLKPKSSTPLPKVVPLTSYPGSESQAAFSPDGERIAFVWDGERADNWDVYVRLVDAGTPLRITTNPAQDFNPVWSPDGRYLAFLRRLGEKSALYLIPSLGGAERKLAEVSILNYGSNLDWSPDGEFLAVVDRSDQQEPYGIFLLSVQTGAKLQLTFPSAEYNGDSNPAFSPDGQTLAFIRIGSMGISDIYLVPVAGGEPRRLTFDNKTLLGLAWTQDGREIVFRSNRGGSNTLWRISASRGAPELISAVGEEAIEPAISRRRSLLAYTRRVMDPNIWRIELSSTTGRVHAPTMLISSTRGEAAPQYSADGKRIAFVSDRSGSMEIWVCDGDGSNARQLTSIGGAHTGTPRWSPDGQRIAFDSRPESQTDIYVINADVGEPRRLTTDRSDDAVPSWSRDGRWVYFGSNRSGDWQVWKVPAEGGAAVQVTRQGGFAALESPDGKFIYYARNRDALGPLWRVPVEGGEEAPVPGFTHIAPWGQWAVLDQGIYFVTAATHPTIEFFNFATGQGTRLAALEKRVLGGPSLAVSSDGRWILYVQVDRNDTDLILVDNFR